MINQLVIEGVAGDSWAFFHSHDAILTFLLVLAKTQLMAVSKTHYQSAVQ